MSANEQILKYLKALCSNQKEVIKTAEDYIKLAIRDNPDAFVKKILSILNDNNLSIIYKQRAILIIKKYFKFRSLSKFHLYYSISEKTRNFFEKEILIIINREKSEKLLKNLTDLISEIFTSLFHQDLENIVIEKKWNNLLINILDLSQDSNQILFKEILNLVSNIIPFQKKFLKDLFKNFEKLFNKGLDYNSDYVKILTVKCLNEFFYLLDFQDLMIMRPFSEKIIKIFPKIFEKKDENKIREISIYFNSICRTHPYFFKNQFSNIIDINNKNFEIFLSYNLLDSIIILVENYKTEICNEKNLKKIIKILVKKILVNNNKKKKEEEESNFIKRILENTDEKEKLISFILDLDELKIDVKNDFNFDKLNIFLSVIEKIQIFIEDKKIIKELYDILNYLKLLKTKNFQIKYMYMITILFKKFDNKEKLEIFSNVIKSLEISDPEIVFISFECIKKIIKNVPLKLLKNNLKKIIELSFFHLKNNSVKIEKEIFDLFSILYEIDFRELNNFTDLLFENLKTILDKNIKPDFFYFKSSIINLLVTISNNEKYHNIKKQKKLKYISEYINNELINIELNDDNRFYIILLCKSLKKICDNNISELFFFYKDFEKSLIKIILLEKIILENKKNEFFKELINVLLLISNNINSEFLEFSNYFEILMNCFKYNLVDLEISIELFAFIMKKFENIKDKFVNEFFIKILLKIEKENDFVKKNFYFYKINIHLKNIKKVLTFKEIINIFKFCENEKNKLNNSKLKIEKNAVFDKYFYNQKEFINELYKNNNALIANFYGTLFKTQKINSIDALHWFYLKELIIINEAPNQLQKLYFLNILIYGIKYIGVFMNQNFLREIMKIFFKFSNFKEIRIIKLISYGIGFLSLLLKNNFINYLDHSIKILSGNLDYIENNVKENKKIYSEIVISAYGKIIQACWSKLTKNRLKVMINFWIKNLPIENNYNEALNQHFLLTNIIINDYTFVLGENFENIEKFLDIFSFIYKSHMSNMEIDYNIEQICKFFYDQSDKKKKLKSENNITFLKNVLLI